MPWHRHAVGRSDRGGRPEERAGPPPQQAGGAGSGEDQHRPPGRGRRGHRPDQGGGSVAPPPGAGQRALPHAEPENRSGRFRRHHSNLTGAARRQGFAGRRGLLVRLRRHQCARGAGILRPAVRQGARTPGCLAVYRSGGAAVRRRRRAVRGGSGVPRGAGRLRRATGGMGGRAAAAMVAGGERRAFGAPAGDAIPATGVGGTAVGAGGDVAGTRADAVARAGAFDRRICSGSGRRCDGER
ncbi:Uncharacterised protein [Serratia marcescens]|nr:Uncharacterised protein [Serratia marcescens]CVA74217.1 Uncharacterised protein [Serratia marcescens]CVB74153.1 Uncharacterised protein [Serratia marcescens]CVC56547.1 Uncharacterised protein [Serratia marcescens]CVC65874.1 Uncharacterised protein [Serratia marcescens]